MVDNGVELAVSNESCSTTDDEPDAELQYFTDLPDDTGESSLVIIQGGVDLDPGDEVGLFDASGIIDSDGNAGNILVGAGVWTGDQIEIVGIEAIDLSQFGGPILPGYVGGNAIVYKVWKASTNTEYNANAEYSAGSGNWGAVLTVISVIEPVFSVTQNLDLDPYSFNMASFNVAIEDASTSSVFGDLDLLLVKDDASAYYVPSFNVDQIQNVNVLEGYKIFLNGGDAQSFAVEGLPCVLSTSIGLDAYTMNLLAYLPQECMATSEVFSGYEDDILVVKNDDSDYYVPAFGVETLAEMCPGEAYAIFLNGADGMDFTYPSDGVVSFDNNLIELNDHALSDDKREMNEDYITRSQRDDVQSTEESQLILFNTVTGVIEEGDILRAYARGELVGSINIVDEHLSGIRGVDLVAHAKTDLTDYVDNKILKGYVEGDAIEVRLFSRARNAELAVVGNLDIGVYGKPLSVGNAVVLDQLATPTSFELTQNYPNPFNPSTTIKYNVEQNGLVSLNVYDIMGRLVKTLVDNQYRVAGNTSGYSVLWNGVDNNGQQVSAGLYIYRLQSGSMSTTNKMILLK